LKKIYIAGPDVFERDAIEIGKRYVELCRKYGFEGLYPLDNVVDFSQPKAKIVEDIFLANKKMIESCDIIVANLNAFRGKEPDSGTVWECGFGVGLGKRVYAYMEETRPYIEHFGDDEKLEVDNGYVDLQGRLIEDFDSPLNLMISCSVERIVQGGFEDVLKVLREQDL